MAVRSNFSLLSLNTFRINVKARYLVEVFNEGDVLEILAKPKFQSLPKLVLGGGSNILLTKNFEGLVFWVKIKGKEVLQETKSGVLIRLGAGESWHGFVTWAVSEGWGGVENLVDIPGTVGAAPVQNIAAYGQDLASVFDGLEAINLEIGAQEIFDKKLCEFGYRESVFKKKLKGKYLITRVLLKLRKNPVLETSYFSMGAYYDSVQQKLAEVAKEPYTIYDVYQAVLSIRQEKLPDVRKIPNAGSFFKNPLVSRHKLAILKKEIPDLQYYPADQLAYRKLDDPEFKKEVYVKVAAGKLLEALGWRGKWVGNCGLYHKHALIVVHNGKATGQEILDFTRMVKGDFFKHYGIELESEVDIF